MGKLFAFFTFLYANGIVISFLMGGATAAASTTLSTSVDDDATTLVVGDTSDFLDADRVWVGNEVVGYTSKTDTTFTGLTRGADDTRASSHTAGVQVYSEPAGVINSLAGFRIMEVIADDNLIKGTYHVITAVPSFFKNAVPKLLLWDFEFLEGHAAWFKYLLLYPLSAGMTVTFIGWVLNRR